MTSFPKSKRFDIAFSHQSRRESDGKTTISWFYSLGFLLLSKLFSNPQFGFIIDVLVGVVFTPPNDPKRPSGSGVKSVPKGDFPGSTDPTADTTKTAKV